MLRRFLSLELLDNRYPALHGLRVLAIISVIQYHVTWILAGEQEIALDGGFTEASLSIFFGMDLFFVLSGFLIGSILLRSLDTQGTQDIRRFYLRRIFRTFPSYWVVLTILAIAMPLTAAQRDHLPFEYAYLTNFMPLQRTEIVMFWGWSLSLEEQFYLTVPLLFFVLHRLPSDRARIAVLIALWALAPVIRVIVFLRGEPWTDFELYDAVYFRTHTRFDAIVAGILLALVHQRYGDRITGWLRAPLHRAVLAIASLTCLWILLRPNLLGPENVQHLHLLTWGTITSLMYFPALLLLLHGGEGWIQRALGRSELRALATLGYGVYLVHIPLIDHAAMPAVRALEERGVSMLLVWPGALAAVTLASFVLAYAMHVLIEKPSLLVRQRLAA